MSLVQLWQLLVRRRDVFIENWIWNVKTWLHFLRERELEYKMQVLCCVKHKILGFHLLEPNRAAEPSMCHCITVPHVVWIARSSATSSVNKTPGVPQHGGVTASSQTHCFYCDAQRDGGKQTPKGFESYKQLDT